MSLPARLLLATFLLLAGAAAAPAAAQPAYNHLRIIAPAAPGGGWDQTARVLQQVLQQTALVRTSSVENIPGAAGTIGLARFVGAERGQGDVLMVSGLIMIGGIVTHRSPVTLHDAVPIARLTGEYEVIVVPAASPFHSLPDLITALQARPEAISWGGGSAGGSDQILAGLVAEAAGVTPSRINYIAFSGGGESLSAIVGGQVTVGINGLAELEGQIEAGTVRALGISSAERLPGVAAATFREQGIDVVFENWRSVVAPPGVGDDDKQRLAQTIDRMVKSTAWHEALARYKWLDRYLPEKEFADFSAAEESRVRDILRKLGTQGVDAHALAASGRYPLFVLVGLALSALAAVTGVMRSARRTGEVVAGAWRPLALIAVGVVVHLLLAERAGFVLAAAALFWVTARAFDQRHPVRDAVFAILVSAGAYLLFVRLLDLSLPSGVLEKWL